MFPNRKTLPHDIPSWVPDHAVFFITINTLPRGTNQLCVQPTADLLWESVKFNQERHVWWPHLFLLMPDHLHALLSFGYEVDPRQAITTWKHFVARRCAIKWQRDFFEHRLRNDESFEEKSTYIELNPVRKGLVSTAEEWPYVWSRFSR